MKMRDMTLHLDRGKLKFSAGHFTIFSKTERETLHGHNYTLSVLVTAEQIAPGITFDYRLLTQKLSGLCQLLHLKFLVPMQSPFLEISEDNQHVEIIFNHESMWLLKKDIVMMPIENISLEDLSQWFIDRITQDQLFLSEHKIKKIVITVYNGPHHGAEAMYERKI
ncbi:MAG: hypothetical protein ACD_29C00403G0003 [uncultured bacterium]|nr:MAG: hypothetical protein ACD_29C00403G0003 [uncultured bacterium]